MIPRPVPIVPGRFATWLYQATGRPARGLAWKIVRRLLIGLRSLRVRLPAEPAVRYRTDEMGEIVLPLSHELGDIMALYPDYSLNLVRLAKVLVRNHPGLTAIDIGANVGDSARLLVAAGCPSVLCVEGSERFLPYLAANVAAQAGCEIAPSFVAFGQPAARIKADYHRGSMHFEPDQSAGAVGLRPLVDILADHPRFAASRLLKIDTDGLDLAILQANLDLIGRVHPVLFFEYLPLYFRKHGSDAGELWAALTGLGYSTVLVYDNFGTYVAALDLGPDRTALLDTLARFEQPDDSSYADLAVFHSEDRESARQVVELERQRT